MISKIYMEKKMNLIMNQVKMNRMKMNQVMKMKMNQVKVNQVKTMKKIERTKDQIREKLFQGNVKRVNNI